MSFYTIPKPFRPRFGPLHDTTKAISTLLDIDLDGWVARTDHAYHETTGIGLYASEDHGILDVALGDELLFSILDHDGRMADTIREIFRRQIRQREDMLRVAIQLIESEKGIDNTSVPDSNSLNSRAANSANQVTMDATSILRRIRARSAQ